MKKEHHYHVYIMANKRNNVLYIGVTSNLNRRFFQHKHKEKPNTFTAKYNINKLVYYENYQYINDALQREKELKRYRRQWKIDLIEKENSIWKDLFKDFDYIY